MALPLLFLFIIVGLVITRLVLLPFEWLAALAVPNWIFWIVGVLLLMGCLGE
ncbi:hypothetical protein H6F43_21100 [Leptolyngbya sp. FACHB-36]|uniref:hypothetical protein n=1 Tax=Leptolyngbya sp. FACHB-36 TaxID=2692808 RepID=UPI00168085B4|nr:hypothetical protein [Leptolyngbya sp. FACHB-36]MBD2022684.1 hypothetical protein [Leptolyngbya sp. FACHB-36]